jgi:hypothetical protein
VTKEKNGKKLKNDLIFISVLLLLVSVSAIGYFFFSPEGDVVTVTVAGEFYGEYSLHENRSVVIRTETTENILTVRDGKAYMESASCPDGLCEKHRPIFRNGESIICLPNQVVLTVTSQNEEAPDIVA